MRREKYIASKAKRHRLNTQKSKLTNANLNYSQADVSTTFRTSFASFTVAAKK